jgi:hypothetical protein
VKSAPGTHFRRDNMNDRIRCGVFGAILLVGVSIMWGVGCQDGSEIPDGVETVNSAASVTITIDATRLTPTELISSCGGVLRFDSTVIQSISAPAGSCVLKTGTNGVIGSFTVTPAGTVDYDPSLDVGVFSGRGTSTLSVVPHAIAIDATGLTQTTLRFVGVTSTPSFDSGGIQHLALASTASVNYVVETAGSGVIGSFTVTPAGTVDYDASTDGVFSGHGTSTLSVVPHAITLDATGLTQTTLRFVGVTSTPSFDSGELQHLALASTASFGYLVETAGSGVIGFFKVTPAGTVDYDASTDGVFAGRGTSTLTVVPHPITIDATGLIRTTLRFIGVTSISSFDSGVIQHFALASTASFGYLVETAGSSVIGFFKVTPAGTVDYDSSLDGRVFSGRNTSILTIVSLE